MSRLEYLKHNGGGYRFKGIVECLDDGNLNDEEKSALLDLTKDNFVMAGRTLSCYAFAVLDVLEILEYQGNDIDVKDLIEGLKNG